MNDLKWEYFKPDDISRYPVASLYTQGNTRILDVFIGNNFYYTDSTGKIQFLPQCFQISYKDALEVIESKVNCSKSQEIEQLRLEAACKIIEDRVKYNIINYFLSTLD